MASFSIKAMQEADVGAVCLIENSIYEFPWSERNFLDSLRAGYIMNCLWLDHQMAGYIVMMHAVDEVHLLNLSIRHDLQGKGYGKLMLDWGLDYARSRNLDGMLLEVRPSNEVAKSLYEKKGFKLIGVRKHYYPAKQGREDALVMFKPFQAIQS